MTLKEFLCYLFRKQRIEADLGDIVASVPDHHKKVSIENKVSYNLFLSIYKKCNTCEAQESKLQQNRCICSLVVVSN